jgi:hypothetical protein
MLAPDEVTPAVTLGNMTCVLAVLEDVMQCIVLKVVPRCIL